MTASGTGTVDERIVKSLGHPLRQRILHVLSEGVASPNQIAQRLGEPLGNVSYHVKILLENDAIELVETRPVRGAIEHFYRGTMRPFLDDAHWAQLPLATRRTIFAQKLEQIGEHVTAAAMANGFDRVETHVSWTPLQLDEQGWHDMAEVLVGVLAEAARIEAESLERLAAAGDSAQPIRSEVAIQHFERAPSERQQGAD
ncbi:MAG TPA: helix-turn-helix domain-containing protein [Gaiellaceae bacterium]|nr:helix-turn-helix domain-containing protein [Gaiellaceae bacterium]